MLLLTNVLLDFLLDAIAEATLNAVAPGLAFNLIGANISCDRLPIVSLLRELSADLIKISMRPTPALVGGAARRTPIDANAVMNRPTSPPLPRLVDRGDGEFMKQPEKQR